MKPFGRARLRLCFALLTAGMLSACTGNVSSGPAERVDPDFASSALSLQFAGQPAISQEGGLAAASADENAPQVSLPKGAYQVQNGGSLAVPFRVQSNSQPVALLVQVEGAGTHFQMPWSATAKSELRSSLNIDIGQEVVEGLFCLLIQLIDQQGLASNTGELCITVLPPAEPEPQVTGISIEPQAMELIEGQSHTFVARRHYDDGSSELASDEVDWSVSDEAVANVDAAGMLTALTAGQIELLARDGQLTGQSVVTVRLKQVSELIVEPATATMEVGVIRQFRAVSRYNDGSTEQNASGVQWMSSNSAVAEVDASGQVTAMLEGSVQITASLDGQQAAVEIQVVPASGDEGPIAESFELEPALRIDEPVVINLRGVLENGGDSSSLTYRLVEDQSLKGAVYDIDGATVRYTPRALAETDAVPYEDSFDYEVIDASGEVSAPGTVTIRIEEGMERESVMLPLPLPESQAHEPSNSAEGIGTVLLSADGRYAFYATERQLLGHSNEKLQLYRQNLQTGEMELVSQDEGGVAGNAAIVSSEGGFTPRANFSVSADGERIAFYSKATNLHPQATDGDSHAYLRDMQSNSVTLLSHMPADDSATIHISANGEFVLFTVNDSTKGQVELFDVQAQTLTRISRTVEEEDGDNSSYAIGVGDDGSAALFLTSAANLAPKMGEINSNKFVLWERSDTAISLTNLGGAKAISQLVANRSAISADGGAIVLQQEASESKCAELGAGDSATVNCRWDRRTGDARILNRIPKGVDVTVYLANELYASPNGRFIQFISSSSAFPGGDQYLALTADLASGLVYYDLLDANGRDLGVRARNGAVSNAGDSIFLTTNGIPYLRRR